MKVRAMMIGAALGCTVAGVGVASTDFSTLPATVNAKTTYNYTLVSENSIRVTCIKYPSDCSYVRSPKLVDDFLIAGELAISPGAINQPVGW